jgi:formylglycine-generating enzyme required for sulfatase activity
MSSRCILVALCLFVTLPGALAVVGAPQAEPPKPIDGALGMKFVPLPKATFCMGWYSEQKKGKKTEIKEDFEIAIHTVTQGQWQALMGNNPSYFCRDGGEKDKVKDIPVEDLKQFPVEGVSWNDAQEFIKKLNAQEAGRGYVYRLPTAAEWEYACRGGATSEKECSYHFYLATPTNDLSSEQANFYGEYPYGKAPKGPTLGRTTKVGSYAPNKLGLYDMHGNVWQWCEELDDNGSGRVSRGGSWGNGGTFCQAAYPYWFAPTSRQSLLGFRLVRIASGGK